MKVSKKLHEVGKIVVKGPQASKAYVGLLSRQARAAVRQSRSTASAALGSGLKRKKIQVRNR